MKVLKLKTTFFSLMAVMALSLLMISCEQESLSIIEDEIDGIRPAEVYTPEATPENENAVVNLDMPDASENMLKFRDIEHFVDFYQQLNMLYDENDQIFNRIVQGFGISSVHEKLSNDEFTNPAEGYQPFLTDPVIMAISNEDFEFQIEDVLMTSISNDFILTSDINDSRTREAIQQMSKGEEIDVNLIPEKAFPVSDNDVDNLLGPWSAGGDYSKAEVINMIAELANNNRNNCKKGDFYGQWTFRQSQNYLNEAIYFRTAAYDNWCCTYEEAKVYSYRRGTSVWQKANGYISATVWADRRDSDCYFDEDESEQKWCTNCKDKRARVNTGGKKYHSTGDVVGHYWKRMGNATIVRGDQTVVFN